jgi:hypothetical protein
MRWILRTGDRHDRGVSLGPVPDAAKEDRRFALLVALYDIERTDEQNSASLLATVAGIHLTFIAGASVVLRSLSPWLRLALPIIPVGIIAFMAMTVVGISLRSSYIRRIEQELSTLTSGTKADNLDYPYFYRLVGELYYPSKRLRWLPLLVTSRTVGIVLLASFFAFVILIFFSVRGIAAGVICSGYIILALIECATYAVAARGDFFSDLRQHVERKLRECSR